MSIETDNIITNLNLADIYIYIVIHRQTVSFYQNSSVWLDTQDAQSRDRNLSNFTLSFRPRWLREFLRYLFRNSSSSCLFTFFYTLSAIRVLNSFKELCITLAAADNSFANKAKFVQSPLSHAKTISLKTKIFTYKPYIYIYIYINKIWH